MSVESLVISELIKQGTPRTALQHGITQEDFELFDEEMRWLLGQYQTKRPITLRRFKQEFPDFVYQDSGEALTDLIDELKEERAFVLINSAVEEITRDLDHRNAIGRAMQLSEMLQTVVKTYHPSSNDLMGADQKHHLKEMRSLQIMRESGEPVGISAGFPTIDEKLGGWQGGNLYVVLGRPGDSKSFFLSHAGTEGMVLGKRIGLFSPEMNSHQHRARVATLLSARPEIQEALHLKGPFRNRDLMDGTGYNLKTYARFWDYVENEIPGEIVLFTQKWRRMKMTTTYIESQIDEYGLDMVIIDPIYKLGSLMKLNGREKIEEITDNLQLMAQAFDIPVIMSNQATRGLVDKKDEAPDKDSSFGSDAPAQEGTCVMGLKFWQDESLLRVRCTKSRFGEPFRFDIHFRPNIGRMVDVTYGKNGYDEEQARELMNALEGTNAHTA